MSDLTTIARPYAKAAFDFAVENSNLAIGARCLLSPLKSQKTNKCTSC